MNPRSSNRPSGRSVVLAFGIAIAVAVALVAVARLGRGAALAPATETPVVDLSGIPQDGRTLGAPDANVTLVEWADPQCPACRLYTEEFFPTVVDEYVRPGRVKTEFRGFPFIGDDSLKAYRFLLAAGDARDRRRYCDNPAGSRWRTRRGSEPRFRAWPDRQESRA